MEKTAVKTDRIICDNGSGYCKVGYGGDSFPRYIFPSIVGKPMLRAAQNIGDVELKPIMVGDEASAVRSMLEISYPLIEGRVKDWDQMKELWDYTFFTKMGLKEDDLKDKYILLTEAAQNPEMNRNKMGEYMFETYGFAGVMFEYQALLTLMAEGNQTGLVLDSGDGVSHCIPVYEGHIQEHNISKLLIAGRHVTEYLVRLLLLRGYAFNSSADYEVVREIKEQLCYMSVNIDKERKLSQETTVLDKEYKLPDGQIINIGRERFEAPEILMRPHLLGEDTSQEDPGLAEMICNSIWKCDMDLQKPLASNIWLSGGTSMIPGLSTRVENEIKALYVKKKGKGDSKILDRVKIQVHDPPRRKNAVFMGASFLASFAGEDRYVSKREYEEAGAKRSSLFKKVY